MIILPSDAVAKSAIYSSIFNPEYDVGISFDFSLYGTAISGTEGFCVFATTDSNPSGGGLERGLFYAPTQTISISGTLNTTFSGKSNALFGVGFDLTGNYSISGNGLSTGHPANSALGPNSAVNVPVPNSITVRSGASTNYAYLSTFSLNKRGFSLYEQVTAGNPKVRTARVRVLHASQALRVELRDNPDSGFIIIDEIPIDAYVVGASAMNLGISFTTGQENGASFEVGNVTFYGNRLQS